MESNGVKIWKEIVKSSESWNLGESTHQVITPKDAPYTMTHRSHKALAPSGAIVFA